ncbi:hypothetical protein SH467x_001507 [Pirellulaceae bacterium SH467]
MATIEHESTLSEKISDSIQGKDEPMETNHPLAPAALVFLTYPMILMVATLAIVGTLWFFGVFGGAGSTTPAESNPALPQPVQPL